MQEKMTKINFYENYNSTNISQHRAANESKTFRVLSKQFVAYLPQSKDAAILDIGCGDGVIMRWLHSLGYVNVRGVDISNEQIEIAKLSGLDVHHADASDFVKGASKIDYVIMRDVLEHLSLEDATNLLQLIKDKHGASLLIQVPNAESFTAPRSLYGDITHYRLFTTHSLTQLFLSVGFKSFKIYPQHVPIVSIASVIRRLVYAILVLFYRVILFAEAGAKRATISRNLVATIETVDEKNSALR